MEVLTGDEIVVREKNSKARGTIGATDGDTPRRRFTPVSPIATIGLAQIITVLVKILIQNFELKWWSLLKIYFSSSHLACRLRGLLLGFRTGLSGPLMLPPSAPTLPSTSFYTRTPSSIIM